jgi:hypothetical protein
VRLSCITVDACQVPGTRNKMTSNQHEHMCCHRHVELGGDPAMDSFVAMQHVHAYHDVTFPGSVQDSSIVIILFITRLLGVCSF